MAGAGRPVHGEIGKAASWGPRPVGALIPALTRPAFRRRSPAGAQIMADWPAIVGPALAAVTAPRRLSAETLTVACSGPVAMELQHLAPQLVARVNAYLGHAAVARLRLTQDFAAPEPPPPPPAPSPETDARAEAAAATLPPGPLRDALAALGRAVLRPRR